MAVIQSNGRVAIFQQFLLENREALNKIPGVSVGDVGGKNGAIDDILGTKTSTALESLLVAAQLHAGKEPTGEFNDESVKTLRDFLVDTRKMDAAQVNTFVDGLKHISAGGELAELHKGYAKADARAIKEAYEASKQIEPDQRGSGEPAPAQPESQPEERENTPKRDPEPEPYRGPTMMAEGFDEVPADDAAMPMTDMSEGAPDPVTEPENKDVLAMETFVYRNKEMLGELPGVDVMKMEEPDGVISEYDANAFKSLVVAAQLTQEAGTVVPDYNKQTMGMLSAFLQNAGYREDAVKEFIDGAKAIKAEESPESPAGPLNSAYMQRATLEIPEVLAHYLADKDIDSNVKADNDASAPVVDDIPVVSPGLSYSTIVPGALVTPTGQMIHTLEQAENYATYAEELNLEGDLVPTHKPTTTAAQEPTGASPKELTEPFMCAVAHKGPVPLDKVPEGYTAFKLATVKEWDAGEPDDRQHRIINAVYTERNLTLAQNAEYTALKEKITEARAEMASLLPEKRGAITEGIKLSKMIDGLREGHRDITQLYKSMPLNIKAEVGGETIDMVVSMDQVEKRDLAGSEKYEDDDWEAIKDAAEEAYEKVEEAGVEGIAVLFKAKVGDTVYDFEMDLNTAKARSFPGADQLSDEQLQGIEAACEQATGDLKAAFTSTADLKIPVTYMADGEKRTENMSLNDVREGYFPGLTKLKPWEWDEINVAKKAGLQAFHEKMMESSNYAMLVERYQDNLVKLIGEKVADKLPEDDFHAHFRTHRARMNNAHFNRYGVQKYSTLDQKFVDLSRNIMEMVEQAREMEKNVDNGVFLVKNSDIEAPKVAETDPAETNPELASSHI